MIFWIVQLRSEFLGILFELLTVRLLLRRSRWAALIAGVCAGVALQFKITMIAALAAGILWLFLKRNWRLLLLFLLGGVATFGGLYFSFSLREPRMIADRLVIPSSVRIPIGSHHPRRAYAEDFDGTGRRIRSY